MKSLPLVILLHTCVFQFASTAPSIATVASQVSKTEVRPIWALLEDNSLKQEALQLQREREQKGTELAQKCAQIEYNPKELLPNEQLAELLAWMGTSDAHTETLLRVFIFVAELDQPICLDRATLNGLSQGNGLAQKVAGRINARLLAAMEEKDAPKMGTVPTAKTAVYVFSANRGVLLLKMQNALQCGQSLQHPRAILQLIWEIYEAIKANEPDQVEFYALLEATFAHLKVVSKGAEIDAYLRSLVIKFNEKWLEIQADMEPSNALERLKDIKDDVEQDLKKFGGKLKSLAVWMFAPSHVEDLIEIILYLVPWTQPVYITRQALAVLGVDKLFEKAAERMGSKLIYNGANVKFVMWWFGPNGLIPLFMREGEKTTDEMPVYVDKDGVPFKQKVEAWKGGMEEEMTFLKKLVEEIIKHKGHPFQELVEHTIANLHKLEHKVDEKWDKIQAKFEAFGKHVVAKWQGIKDAGFQGLMHKMGTSMKKFAIWLITPDRIVKTLDLLLSLTPVQVPIYLTLEVLEAFGVTDLLIKEFGILDNALEKHVKAFRKGAKLDKVLHFAIGKEGVLPLFLKMGNTSENDERQRVLQDEANLVKVLINVVFKHQANGMQQLNALLLDKLKLKPLLLEIFQRWNLWNKKLFAKFGPKYVEFANNQAKQRKDNALDLWMAENGHSLTKKDFEFNLRNLSAFVRRQFQYDEGINSAIGYY